VLAKKGGEGDCIPQEGRQGWCEGKKAARVEQGTDIQLRAEGRGMALPSGLSHLSTNSTRRFSAFPSSVRLDAAGE